MLGQRLFSPPNGDTQLRQSTAGANQRRRLQPPHTHVLFTISPHAYLHDGIHVVLAVPVGLVHVGQARLHVLGRLVHG